MESAATGALHPDLADYSAAIRETLANFEALLAGLTHLNNLNSQDLAPMSANIANARARGLMHPGPYKIGWMNRYFINQMEPPVKRKFKVPKQYEPAPQAGLAPTLNEYRRICHGLLHLLQQANGLDLARVKTTMPALPWLMMPLAARFALLTAHDRRHLAQARDVRNHPGFPS
jgi:hypothetical protein